MQVCFNIKINKYRPRCHVECLFKNSNFEQAHLRKPQECNHVCACAGQLDDTDSCYDRR